MGLRRGPTFPDTAAPFELLIFLAIFFFLPLFPFVLFVVLFGFGQRQFLSG